MGYFATVKLKLVINRIVARTMSFMDKRLARFMAKTKEAETPHPNLGTKCLLWTAAIINTMGHGACNWRGRPTTAHRVSWMLFRGSIPDRLCVLHRCDVPSCVNPEHLWLGTRRDNMEDAARKCRMRSKLSLDDVKEIRARKTTRKGTTALAQEFGVSQQTICGIVGRTLRQHIT